MIDLDTKLKIGSIGSCRVKTPLRMAHASGRIEHLGGGPLAFVHNPLEIVQGLEQLTGKKGMPGKELMKLVAIARPVNQATNFSSTIGRADVAIIEISSIRIAEYLSWQLQIHMLRNFLENCGLSSDSLYAKESVPGRAAAVAVAGQVNNEPDFSLANRLVADGKFYELSEQQTDEAILAICDLVRKPILFVGISPVRPGSGALVKQRVIIRDSLARVSAIVPNVRVFDPSSFLDDYPFRNVFKDMGHYQEAFLPVVADRLIAESRELTRGIHHQDTSPTSQ